MDRELKVFEHFDAAADSGGQVANTLDNLRYMLQRLYVMGAGAGMSTWCEEDRDRFLGMLLDAGEGRNFIPIPSPWPPERREDAEVIDDLNRLAKLYKDRPNIADAMLAIAKDLKNGV